MSDQRLTVVLPPGLARELLITGIPEEIALWENTFNLIWPEGLKP